MESGREDEFDRNFDEAVEYVKKNVLGRKFPMIIGGKEAFANEELVEYSPIDKSIIGRFQKGDRASARLAIEAAA
ncbi:MAG: hypothetical protein QXR73_03880, partial [Candidatus Micrarchaeaceae archaeon]